MALTGESLETLKYFMENAEAAFYKRFNMNETTKIPNIDYAGILDKDLTALSRTQRLTFQISVGILCVLSLCGNLSTLYVNSRRKMRPFFRTCLISLALSDLLSTIFLTWTHFPQFIAEYVQIWLLSCYMCRFIPLVTTAAILASSMTLVGIALDRNFAIRKAAVNFWDPGVAYCILFAFVIWFLSFGIATPVMFIYRTSSVWIMTEVDYLSEEFPTTIAWNFYNLYSDDDGQGRTLQPKELVTMCLSDQQDVALYYVIVFSIIFVPCIVAFIWLNSIIARKIWNRRHRPAPPSPPPQQQQSNDKPPNGRSTKEATSSTRKKPIGYSSAREARHIRMFVVIVILMAVFIILRIPVWIFLVLRTYGSYKKPHDWIVYFCFSAMNLGSCALNPLFYTFLPETLKYLSCFRRLIWPKTNDGEKTTATSKNWGYCARCQKQIARCLCCGFFCGTKLSASDQESASSRTSSRRQGAHVGFDIDEGVDCSDDGSYEEVEIEMRSQQICIVFTPSLAETSNQR